MSANEAPKHSLEDKADHVVHYQGDIAATEKVEVSPEVVSVTEVEAGVKRIVADTA